MEARGGYRQRRRGREGKERDMQRQCERGKEPFAISGGGAEGRAHSFAVTDSVTADSNIERVVISQFVIFIRYQPPTPFPVSPKQIPLINKAWGSDTGCSGFLAVLWNRIQHQNPQEDTAHIGERSVGRE